MKLSQFTFIKLIFPSRYKKPSFEGQINSNTVDLLIFFGVLCFDVILWQREFFGWLDKWLKEEG